MEESVTEINLRAIKCKRLTLMYARRPREAHRVIFHLPQHVAFRAGAVVRAGHPDRAVGVVVARCVGGPIVRGIILLDAAHNRLDIYRLACTKEAHDESVILVCFDDPAVAVHYAEVRPVRQDHYQRADLEIRAGRYPPLLRGPRLPPLRLLLPPAARCHGDARSRDAIQRKVVMPADHAILRENRSAVKSVVELGVPDSTSG